ncbi:MAG TPA: hypothetical protein PLG33_09490, partial [Prolixibacteraceae bacterium]|nr:hypothetical protein [Prolixibacteraceae bacterium]
MISPDLLLNLSWVVTLIAIFAICLVPSKLKAYAAAFSVIVNAITTSIPAFQALGGSITDISLAAGSFLGSIPIRIDGLSAWFIVIINFTSVTGA